MSDTDAKTPDEATRPSATPVAANPSSPGPDASAPDNASGASGAPPREARDNNRDRRHRRNRNDRERTRNSGGRAPGPGLPRDDFDEDAEDNTPRDPSRLINLTELKRKPAAALLDFAETLGVHEGVARARKQDVIFNILKAHARSGGSIWSEGVLEIMQDGYGFLRSADESYLAGPDDVYVSPSQIRRYNLRTGD